MSQLLKAAKALRKDMLNRAEIVDGVKVVNCGATAWSNFNEALDNAANKMAAASEMYAVLEDWLDSGYMKRGDVEKLLAKARGEA